MEANVVFRTPLEIEGYLNREYPILNVQIDGEQEVIKIDFPESWELPNGRQIVLSSLVPRAALVEVIAAVYLRDLLPDEASEALKSLTPLSGWDEARRSIQRRSINETPWWSAAAHFIAQTATSVGTAIVEFSSAGGMYPPTSQTVLVALQAITAVGACIGQVCIAPSVGISALLRLANIIVLAGRCNNPALKSATGNAQKELLAYWVAIPLLLIPGPWGVIASGIVSSLPEAAAWLAKFRHIDKGPIAARLLNAVVGDPKDPEVARRMLRVSEEGMDPASVDRFYDYRYQCCVNWMANAREKGRPSVVELFRTELVRLNQAYITLMGHPRSTGVD